MKENERNTKRKENEIKKKKFYLALFGSVGTMAVVAVVLAFGNLGIDLSGNSEPEQSNQVTLESEPSVGVNSAKDKTISEVLAEGEIGNSIIFGGESELGRKETPTETPKETIVPEKTTPNNSTPTDSAVPAEKSQSSEKAVPTQEATPAPKQQSEAEAENSEPFTSAIPLDHEEVAKEEDEEEILKVEPPVNNLFTNFDEEDKMSWPIKGEIVMDFSVDKLVYDETLEHFTVNETVAIAAPLGTEVKAAAEGIIKGISNTKEFGTAVVIEHGNGWVTTYSQLNDTVLVKLGDVVQKEQAIGNVANPSVYRSKIGTHVGFEIEKDNIAQNPHLIVLE